MSRISVSEAKYGYSVYQDNKKIGEIWPKAHDGMSICLNAEDAQVFTLSDIEKILDLMKNLK